MSLRDRLDAVFVDPESLELTAGAIARPLCALSLPVVVTNLLQTAYNLADTFWLGQYGTTELAAISFAFPTVFLFLSLGLGLSVAGSVLVAQHTGAGEEATATAAASQTITLTALAGLLAGVVCYLFVGDLFALLGAEPAVHAAATTYMRILSAGMAPLFVFYTFVALMRGSGDTLTPMAVMAVTVALNVALDPFLIHGWWVAPELGIVGAAVATVACRSLAAVVGLWLLVDGRRGVSIRVGHLVPDREAIARLVRLGAPTALEEGGRAVSITAMLLVVGLFQTAVVAGYGIGVRVFSLLVLPAIAVGSGVETMTGQNVGAGEHARVRRINHVAATGLFAVLTVLGVAIALAAEPLVGLFTPDAEAAAAGASFLGYAAPTLGAVGVMRAYTGGFRGAGSTVVAACVVVGFLAVVRLPLAYAASTVGPSAVWAVFGLSNVVGGALAAGLFASGRWVGGRDGVDGPDRSATGAGSD